MMAMVAEKRSGKAATKAVKVGRPLVAKKARSVKPIGTRGPQRSEAAGGALLTREQVRHILDEIDRNLSAAEAFYGIASKA